MYSLRKSDKFDGVIFILPKDEFDSVIASLKDSSYFYRTREISAEYVKRVDRVAEVLATKSYFDEAAEEVRCMLGFGELNYLLDVLIKILPMSKGIDINFDKCLANPKTKRWITRKRKEEEYEKL